MVSNISGARIKPRKAATIGFFSAKGGVGKTTIAVNVATRLAEKWNGNVLLVDVNLTSPNLSIYLGELNPDLTLHGVLDGEFPIEKAIKNLGKMDAIYGSPGFGEMGHRIDLDSYLQPLKSKYRVILLDTAPALGNEAVSAMKACDEMVAVTTPDYPSVVSTLQTFRAAEQHKVPVHGIVVNRALERDFELPSGEIRDTLGWPVLSEIPEDEKVRESTALGVPVIDHDPGSPASEKLRELSRKIGEHIEGK